MNNTRNTSNYSIPIEGEGKGRGSYKRGTITKDGKRYGFYPDGTLYRIYDHDIPFTQWVDVDGETFLRVRQATEIGYTDCPVSGCCDLAYPSSTIRRSRTVGGVNLLMHSHVDNNFTSS